MRDAVDEAISCGALEDVQCEYSPPPILSDAELRAGIALQLKELDRLRRLLRAESDRVLELRDALHSLAFVARRYLPDYDEHPEIQRADDLLFGLSTAALAAKGE